MNGVNHTTLYVCAVLSRVNHSCLPNAVVGWDPTRNLATHYAVQSIPNNREITVDCMAGVETTFTSRKKRRDELEGAYGFVCACNVCSQPWALVQRSDIFRRNTAALRRQVLGIQPLQAAVDFNVRANHRSRMLDLHNRYIANLVQLGALDGKVIEAQVSPVVSC